MDKEEYINKFGIEAYNEHPSKKGKKLDKYSICNSSILKTLWKGLEDILKTDFGIEIVHDYTEYNTRKYSILKLYDKNKLYMCTFKYISTKALLMLVRDDCYVLKYDHTPRKGYYPVKGWPISTVNDVNQLVEEHYMSDIFTSLIDLIGYINGIEPKIKEEFEENQMRKIQINDEIKNQTELRGLKCAI